jgi:integrase/recombinase XerD
MTNLEVPPNTYWYLEATPVLLRDIAAASEQLFQGEAA